MREDGNHVRFEAHYGLKSDIAPCPKTFTLAEVAHLVCTGEHLAVRWSFGQPGLPQSAQWPDGRSKHIRQWLGCGNSIPR